ncbi:hypothetical protein AAFF_G00122220 [Aldrovandia affinis]|uniref:Uncharacterized protein n=1 Tax=Aldrovandia affinis TaxID=143900 RepID=A0AAD7W9U1_9TELE|nr:hypothetical protein AAFF_G00122220 [Aldrovandia affinis]
MRSKSIRDPAETVSEGTPTDFLPSADGVPLAHFLRPADPQTPFPSQRAQAKCAVFRPGGAAAQSSVPGPAVCLRDGTPNAG